MTYVKKANLGSDSDVMRRLRASYYPEFKYRLEATWYQLILYKHGLQNVRFNVDAAKPSFLSGRGRRRANIVYNLMLRYAEDAKAAYISQSYDWKVSPLTRDERDIQAARRASDYLRHFQHRVDRQGLEETAADWLVSTGNTFIYVVWDKNVGDDVLVMNDDGEPELEKTGDVVIHVDSPFRWSFHPHATTISESDRAIRRSAMSRRDAARLTPDFDVESVEGVRASDQRSFWEYSLLTFSAQHGFYTAGFEPTDEEESFVEVFEAYFLPDNEFPKGLYVVAYGSGSGPQQIALVKDMPYKELPVVHMGEVRVPGRLYYDAVLAHAMSPQREINRRIQQIIENGNLTANPKLVVPDSIPDGHLTNQIGGTLPIPDTASMQPYFLRPPDMPSYISQQIERSIQLLDVILAPFGPGSALPPKGVSSGIQLSLMQQQQNRKIYPRIRNWERGWERVYTMVLDRFREYAKLPHRVDVGVEGSFREYYLRGSDFDGARIRFEVVPGTSMPKDRAASLAEWLELLKVMGPVVIQNPQYMQRFHEDMGWGDMVASHKSWNLDAEKAHRNVAKCRAGIPVVPDQVDDPMIHLPIYEEVMKTEEWESEWSEPSKLLLRTLYQQMRMLLALKLGAGEGLVPGADQIGGPPGGNQLRSQGTSTSPSPFRNEGGAGGGMAPAASPGATG